MPEIRKATANDATQIFQIVKTQTQHLHHHKGYNDWLHTYYSPRHLVERFEKEIVYVSVTKADLTVGSVFLNPEGNYVGGIYIHPFFQRQGIGTQLLTKLFDEHKNQTFVSATEHDNISSQNLLKKFGYRIQGEPWPGNPHLSSVKWITLVKEHIDTL